VGRAPPDGQVHRLEDALRRAVLTGLLLLVPSWNAANAAPRPRALVTSNGALAITLPPALLQRNEVTRQLTSGLTTIFVVVVDAVDESAATRGALRIDVRLDLWEEKYLVTVIEGTAQQRKLSFAAEDELRRWWSTTPLLAVPPRKFGPRVDVAVRLIMLPFSRQEQSNTERWLARTLAANRAPGGETLKPQSAEILRIIVESSVRRRPLLEERWSVRAEREEPQ
jgi:hypothetical protein